MVLLSLQIKKILVLLALAIPLVTGCKTSTETPAKQQADECKIYLQTWYNHTPVKVYVDNASIFNDTVSTGYILAFAAIIPVEIKAGSHNLRVSIADSVFGYTRFTIEDSLYIGVYYDSGKPEVNFEFREKPYMYR